MITRRTRKTSASFLLSLNSLLPYRFLSFYLLYRYGAVVRGANAYVPTGARKGNSGGLPPVTEGSVSSSSTTTPKPEIPKLAVNAPDGTTVAVANAVSPATKVRYSLHCFCHGDHSHAALLFTFGTMVHD